MYMKVEKGESKYSDKYPMRDAKDMSRRELCNWIALCNALKFINHTSSMTGRFIDESDIVYKEMIHYITAVSGDMATCLRETDGIPFKYSLCTSESGTTDIEEVNYEFLG